MATSGELKTNVDYDSWFWVKWSQSEQDIANNRTKISWSCGVHCGHTFYLNAIKMSAVSINGAQVYAGGTYSNYAHDDFTLGSGTLWINHNADGTKTFSISAFTGWLYENHNYSSNGEGYSLTAIPRQATITSAPNFTDQDNPVITYSNPAGNAVTQLRACISLTGESSDIAYRDIPKTGSSYTFNLTDAERNVLRNNTTGPNRTVSFFVHTVIGSNKYWSSLSRTFSVEETASTKPKVSTDATLNNGTLPSKFAGLYIQGKSRVNLTLYAEGKYNATIKSFSAKVDGKSHNNLVVNSKDGYYATDTITSDVLNNAGEIYIGGYATDSRGFSGEHIVSRTVIEYSKPTLSSSTTCYRSDGNGKKVENSTSIWIKAGRSYHKVNGKNTCSLQWRWKESLETWNDTKHPWKNLLSYSNTSTDLYNGLIQGVVFEQAKSYTVQVRVIDDIGDYSIKTFDIPTDGVALHLGKGGKNIAVGRYCDYSKEHTFHSAWDAIFDKSINGMYVKHLNVNGGTEILLQSQFQNWNANGTSRQCFLVFGSANALPVHGICVLHDSGTIRASTITNCSATCEATGGVVKLTLGTTAWDDFVILSTAPFTII